MSDVTVAERSWQCALPCSIILQVSGQLAVLSFYRNWTKTWHKQWTLLCSTDVWNKHWSWTCIDKIICEPKSQHIWSTVDRHASLRSYDTNRQMPRSWPDTQPFNGPLSRTTWVSRYQKKHSPTHKDEEEKEWFTQTARSIAWEHGALSQQGLLDPIKPAYKQSRQINSQHL